MAPFEDSLCYPVSPSAQLMNHVPNASFAVKVKVRCWSKAVRIGIADCPYCHRSDVCISRPKSLLEEVAILALLRPARCRDCFRRFYRPLFVATPVSSLCSRGGQKASSTRLLRLVTGTLGR
jgi:hypothetical protein